MSKPPPTMYAVFSADRLKTLMERTGTGDQITSRELAARAGVAHGTIGSLMSGAQQLVPEPKAQAISDALSVPLPLLFVRMERTGRTWVPVQESA